MRLSSLARQYGYVNEFTPPPPTLYLWKIKLIRKLIDDSIHSQTIKTEDKFWVAI